MSWLPCTSSCAGNDKDRPAAVLARVVPEAGFEPARGFPHYPLKIACLPIPPSRHASLGRLPPVPGAGGAALPAAGAGAVLCGSGGARRVGRARIEGADVEGGSCACEARSRARCCSRCRRRRALAAAREHRQQDGHRHERDGQPRRGLGEERRRAAAAEQRSAPSPPPKAPARPPPLPACSSTTRIRATQMRM